MVAPSLVDIIFDFMDAYRSENLLLKYEQLVLLPFGQHPRLTAIEQDWADQGLFLTLLWLTGSYRRYLYHR
jgi:hypothetical protein